MPETSLKGARIFALALTAGLAVASDAVARDADYGRLPTAQLDVTAPSERVRGAAGEMRADQMAPVPCHSRNAQASMPIYGRAGIGLLRFSHRRLHQFRRRHALRSGELALPFPEPPARGSRACRCLGCRLLGGHVARCRDDLAPEPGLERAVGHQRPLGRSVVRGIHLLGDVRSGPRREQPIPARDRALVLYRSGHPGP